MKFITTIILSTFTLSSFAQNYCHDAYKNSSYQLKRKYYSSRSSSSGGNLAAIVMVAVPPSALTLIVPFGLGLAMVQHEKGKARDEKYKLTRSIIGAINGTDKGKEYLTYLQNKAPTSSADEVQSIIEELVNNRQLCEQGVYLDGIAMNSLIISKLSKSHRIVPDCSVELDVGQKFKVGAGNLKITGIPDIFTANKEANKLAADGICIK